MNALFSKFRQYSLERPWLLFFLYCIPILFIYIGAHDIVLNDDAFQFFAEYEKESWGGFYQNYGFTSLYYVTHFLNILLYTLFGTNTFYWLIVLILLHAFNAYLGFRVFYRFYTVHQINNAFEIALLGSLFFLLSPSQSENISWVATLHYGISMLFFLAVALYLLNNLQELTNTKKLLLFFVYVLSLLSMEYALVFPFCWFLLIPQSYKSFKSFQNKYLWLGFLIIIPFYFIATKLIKGHFIPHYSERHLINHSLFQYLKSYISYSSKYLLLSHFYKYSSKYYDFLTRTSLMLSICVGLIIILYYYFKKNKETILVFLKLFVVSFFMLMPIINMFFCIIHQYENNRLGYFFSLLFFQLCFFTLYNYIKKGRIAFAVLLLTANVYFSFIVARDLKIAGHIYKNCVRTFPDLRHKKIYLLNLPNNYKGIYLFRSPWRLEAAISFFNHKEYSFNEIASTNILRANDSFALYTITDTTLKVGHNNLGDYFMRGPYGAYDREDSAYSFDVDEWLMNYEVRFKKPLSAHDQLLLFNQDRFEVLR
jgi:hypothetical protein